MRPPRIACIYQEAQSDELQWKGFAEACFRFSPQVALHSPHAIWVEIGKSRRLFSEDFFVRRVLVLAKRFGSSPVVAIDSHALTAYLGAKFGVKTIEALPLPALIDTADPLGRDPVARKSVMRLLTALEIVGVKSMNEFLALPAAQLTSRFGSLSLLIRQRLARESDLAWPRFQPEEVVIEKKSLGYDEQTRDLDPLLFLLKPLLDRVFSRLWARGRQLASLEVEIECERYQSMKNTPKLVFKLDFLLPQISSRGSLPIIRERLSREFEKKPLPSFCTGVRLTVLGHLPGYEGQRNFLAANEDQSEEWSAVLSHLAETLGSKGKVFKAKLSEERLPEHSWTRAAFKDPEGPQLELQRILAKRPSRLLRRPEPVEVAHEKIFIRKRPYKILNWSKPEIITEWLRSSVQRRYYRVCLEGVPAAWVFCDEKDAYYLHGYFE